MKVVITGGNGYIGSRLSRYLSEHGQLVTAVCFPEIPKDDKWSNNIHRTIIGDITDTETIDEIAAINADAIIHLVSLDHYESEKHPNQVSKVNVQPTWNLLNACTVKGLKKFIYFSTIHVYGRNLAGIINEDQQTIPFNAYGLTHYLSEEICNYYNRKTDTNCINIRLSNSYGEPVLQGANCWDLIVNDLVRSAFTNKKIVLKSDGGALRDFVHYSDICKGVHKLLTHTECYNKNTINFSSSNSIRMIDVALTVQKTFAKRYKQNIPIYINEDEPYNGEQKRETKLNTISNSLANSLSIEFKKELKSGIEDLFIYFETEACQKFQ